MEAKDERWDYFLESYQKVVERLKDSETHLRSAAPYLPEEFANDVLEFLGDELEDDTN